MKVNRKINSIVRIVGYLRRWSWLGSSDASPAPTRQPRRHLIPRICTNCQLAQAHMSDECDPELCQRERQTYTLSADDNGYLTSQGVIPGSAQCLNATPRCRPGIPPVSLLLRLLPPAYPPAGLQPLSIPALAPAPSLPTGARYAPPPGLVG